MLISTQLSPSLGPRLLGILAQHLPHAPETGNKAKTHHAPAQILLFSEGRHIHDLSKASELLNAL